MTAESVTAEQSNVDREDACANADAEMIVEGERFPNVVRKNAHENAGEIKKRPARVLHHQWKRTVTPITFARLADSTRGRIRPEGFVIRTSIIITGKSKPSRPPENQKRR